MTDTESIKALECCIEAKCASDCEKLKCPAFRPECCVYVGRAFDEDDFIIELIKDALDLIERQQAEIERLKKENTVLREDNHILATEYAVKAKSKAIKEFAERLKEEPIKCGLPLLGLQTKEEIETYFDSIMLQVKDAIDNTVKEMEEEYEGN